MGLHATVHRHVEAVELPNSQITEGPSLTKSSLSTPGSGLSLCVDQLAHGKIEASALTQTIAEASRACSSTLHSSFFLLLHQRISVYASQGTARWVSPTHITTQLDSILTHVPSQTHYLLISNQPTHQDV